MTNTNKAVIQTAINTNVHINKLHEITGLNGGDENSSRWDVKNTTVEKVREQLIESITTTGFLTGVIGVKTSEDTELFGKTYPKNNYLVLDESGRTRVLQHLAKNGYVINPDTELEGQVPVLDVTHLVTNGSKEITEDVVQKIWQAIVKLNTGALKWTDYDYLSSGSRSITDPRQKEIWKYLVDTMRKYHPTLSNKVVLGGTINALTDKMINEATIDFDLDTYARYSNHILDGLVEIRERWGSSNTMAPFLKAFARYSFLAAENNSFVAGEYDDFGKPIMTTHKVYFEIDPKLSVGTDRHFTEFVYYYDIIVRGLMSIRPPKGGYSGTAAAATKEFKENIVLIYNDKKRGIQS
jgi:hypothetical protein